MHCPHSYPCCPPPVLSSQFRSDGMQTTGTTLRAMQQLCGQLKTTYMHCPHSCPCCPPPVLSSQFRSDCMQTTGITLQATQQLFGQLETTCIHCPHSCPCCPHSSGRMACRQLEQLFEQRNYCVDNLRQLACLVHVVHHLCFPHSSDRMACRQLYE